MLKLSRDYAAQARTASGVNISLGIWLTVSPWVFSYSGKPAMLSSTTVGVLIALLAAIRVISLRDSAGLSGINLLLGFWTVVSPWVYEYSPNGAALSNDILVGTLVAALAIWSALATDADRRHGRNASVH
jgi:hypothetical protein